MSGDKMFSVLSSDEVFNSAASITLSQAGFPVERSPTLLALTLAKGLNASEIVERAARGAATSNELVQLFRAPSRPGLPVAPNDLLGSGDEGQLHVLTSRAEGAIDAFMQTDGVAEVRFVREAVTPGLR